MSTVQLQSNKITNSAAPFDGLTAPARVKYLIKNWIDEGKFTGGERLPSEQALCAETGFSRNTIRAALKNLSDNGAITQVQGKRGWHICDDRSAGPPTNLMVGIVSELQTQPRDQYRATGWKMFALFGLLQALAAQEKIGVMQTPAQFLHSGAADYLAYLATHDACANPQILEKLSRLREQGAVVVTQDDTEEELPFDQVLSDHTLGEKLATEYLLARGCRKILRYFPVSLPREAHPHNFGWQAMRERGFAEAHRAAGITPPPSPIVYREHQRGVLADTTREVFDWVTDMAVGWLVRAAALTPDFDGIICVTDGEVAPLKKALCLLRGEAAAQKVLIAGYDNYWLDSPERAWSDYRPDVTVDKNNLQIGKTLAEVLNERFENPEAPRIVRRVAPELVVIKN